MSINDNYFDALYASYTGSNGDMRRSRLEALGASGATINDMEQEYLGTLGYTGALNDRWLKYLKALDSTADSLGALGRLLSTTFYAGVSPLSYAAAGFTPSLIADFETDNYFKPTPVYGPELVTNGTFDTDTTGWTPLTSATLSVASNALRVTNVGANFGKAEQEITTVVGRYYEWTFDFVGGTSANFNYRAGTTSAGFDIVSNTAATSGTNTVTFIAQSTSTFLTFVNDGTDGNYTDWDNVSVKEVTGYTATTTTFSDLITYTGASNKLMTSDGLLKWAPHNELAYSEDAASADSGRVDVVTADIAGPFAGTTADRITQQAGQTIAGYVGSLGSGWFPGGPENTYKAIVKNGDCDWVYIQMNTSSTSRIAWFNLSTGTVGTVKSSTTASIEDLGDGWYELTVVVATAGWAILLLADGDNSTTATPGEFYYLHRRQNSRTDLGGMAPVPVADRIAGSETYVPTTSAAVYLSRRGNEVYDSTTAKYNAHNLATDSEQFSNAAWSKSSSSATDNVALAPDGTTTASRLLEASTGATIHRMQQNTIAINTASGAARVSAAVWAKRDPDSPATRNMEIVLNVMKNAAGTSGFVSSRINLSDGSVSTNFDSISGLNRAITVEAFPDDWYLITLSADYLFISSSNLVQFMLGLTDGSANSYAGDGVSSGFFWGAHAYRSDLNGVVANSGNSASGLYVPTTTTAVPATLNTALSYPVKGMALESAAATNLITYSQDFSQTIWGNGLSGEIAASGISPDGTTNATKLVDTSGGGTGTSYLQANLPTLSATTQYTFSIHAKADGLSWVGIGGAGWSDGSLGGSVSYFDLATPALGTSAGDKTTIEDLGDGWVRCGLTFTTGADTSGLLRIYLADANGDAVVDQDGTSSILIYGAQLETGSVPTSYIPTSGATATRAAETSTIAAANMPYSSVNMSFQMDGLVTYADTESTEEVSFFLYGSGLKQFRLRTTGGDLWRFQDGGTLDDVAGDGLEGVNVPYSIASRSVSGVEIEAALNGTASGSPTVIGAYPDTSATDFTLANVYTGTIGQFLGWSDDITDAGIEETSTP